MPLSRKIIKVGHSRGTTFPKGWLKMVEANIGKEVNEVSIEVNGGLTILPMVDGKPVVIQNIIINANKDEGNGKESNKDCRTKPTRPTQSPPPNHQHPQSPNQFPRLHHPRHQ